MPRALFEKTGSAVWISHLDLMRLFQRAFKRAGLPLTHTQGFSPRPSVSIALPLSVGIESGCELLDFDLEGEKIPCDEILARLNTGLVDGIRVFRVYDNGAKLKNLTYLDCVLTMEYDQGIPENALSAVVELFARSEVIVEKRTKNGMKEENIIPMIHKLEVVAADTHCMELHARVCCQNPTLNPMQLAAAVERYLPEYKADFVKCRRVDIYDANENRFR